MSKISELVENGKRGSSEKMRLSPLETEDQFYDKMDETNSIENNPKLKEDSVEVSKILGAKNLAYPNTFLYGKEEVPQYEAVRRKIGREIVNDGVYAMKRFTDSSSYSHAIGQADKGITSSSSFTKLSNDLNKLFTSEELPRTEVEKFRGFRASPDRLQSMVEGVGKGGSFTHNRAYSWSSSLEISQQFSNVDVEKAPDRVEKVIYRSINRRGIPIGYSSSIFTEHEILTPRNTKYKYVAYRVINVEGEDYHIFDVEEFS